MRVSSDGPSSTERLIRQAVSGDELPMNRLLNRYRNRLKRLVAVRMSDEVRARVDASDVAQDGASEIFFSTQSCWTVTDRTMGNATCGTSPGTIRGAVDTSLTTSCPAMTTRSGAFAFHLMGSGSLPREPMA